MKVIVVGAGVAGLASALALTKWQPEELEVTVLEIRPQPSTIGGAVGLTPNAIRCLHHLDVLQSIRAHGFGVEIDRIELFNIYSGGRLGEILFAGPTGDGVGDPPFKGLRIMRADLVQALTNRAKSLRNIDLKYNCKVVDISETAEHVTVRLEDGPALVADVLLGCDGIHSFVRTSLVDPDRTAGYTGIAAVFGFAPMGDDTQQVPWKDTGLCQSQRGSLMTTYFEPTRSKQFVAAIMETEDVASKEGWRARGSEQDRIKQSVKERYGNSAVKIECLDSLISATEHWTLYPVYKLAPKGRWCSQRTMLLGDAAHAMPPQGESTAYALEDAILFARAMQGRPVQEAFDTYQRWRRQAIDKAYEESTFGWETQKDCSWFSFLLKAWLTTIFLWWTSTARQKRYGEDVAIMDLDSVSG